MKDAAPHLRELLEVMPDRLLVKYLVREFGCALCGADGSNIWSAPEVRKAEHRGPFVFGCKACDRFWRVRPGQVEEAMKRAQEDRDDLEWSASVAAEQGEGLDW